MKDPNWWQAKHIGTDELTGLIPSQELEERRKAFVPPEADFVHTISICGTKVNFFFFNYYCLLLHLSKLLKFIYYKTNYFHCLFIDIQKETEKIV